jgi:hypothetical protein
LNELRKWQSGELTQVPRGLDSATFGGCWQILASICWKKSTDMKSKFDRKQEFLPVNFDNLSADLEKEWSLCK